MAMASWTCLGSGSGGSCGTAISEKGTSLSWKPQNTGRNGPSNRRASPVSATTAAQRDAVQVAVADWNGDGKLDLIVGDFMSGEERKYHGWVWVYLRKNPAVTAQVTP